MTPTRYEIVIEKNGTRYEISFIRRRSARGLIDYFVGNLKALEPICDLFGPWMLSADYDSVRKAIILGNGAHIRFTNRTERQAKQEGCNPSAWVVARPTAMTDASRSGGK